MSKLIGIGFWNTFNVTDFPDPGKFQKNVNEDDRKKLITYLSNGKLCAEFLSDDWCRFRCETSSLGKSYLTDGVYIWPSSLIHYIIEHNVYLPDEFISYMNNVGNGNQAFNLNFTIDTNWWKNQKGFDSNGQSYLYPTIELENALKNRKLS